MNNSKTKTIVWTLVAVAILGGIFYYTMNNSGSNVIPSDTGTTTPTTSTTANSQLPSKKSGLPIVKTETTSYVSQSSIVLNGQVSPNGVQTSYWYEYGETQSLGQVAGVQLLGAGYGTYQAPTYVTGLKSNTIYYFRINAQNQYGKVSGEIINFKTNNTSPAPSYPPTAQTNGATDITQKTATLRGIVNPNNSGANYWIEYGTTLSLGYTTPVQALSSGSSDTSVSSNISGLVENTTYYFRLNAQNNYGTVNGNILSFTTKSSNPPVPSKGSAPTVDTNNASNVTKDSANLKGDIKSNEAQTTYYFEYGKATLLGLFDLNQKTASKSVGAGKTLTSVSENVFPAPTDLEAVF